MAATILGFAGLTETGRRGSFGTRGVSTEVHYAGPVDAVKAALGTLTSSGWDVEYDITNPPVGTLLVRTPDYGDGNGTGIVQTQFDLVANTTQLSAYEHPTSLALGETTLNQIRQGQKNGVEPSGLSGNASTLWTMLSLGQDSFVKSQFVFRLTQYFVNGTILDIAYEDVNKVYSTANLIIETNPTALYISALNECATQFYADTYGGATPSGHTFGWLKQAPQLNNVSGNRSALTVEYWLEAWRNYFYA